MMKQRLRLLTGALICSALVLAACGDDDDSSETTDAVGTVAPAATDTATTDAAATTVVTDETEAPADTTGTTAAAAEGTSLDALIEAANAEGSLTVYSDWPETQFREVAAAFTEKYGIPVEVVRDAVANLAPAVQIELDSDQGIADAVISADKPFITTMGANGDLVEPVGPAFEGLTDYDNELFVSDDNYFEVGGALSVFGWNSGEVPDGVHDFEAFLDPALSGGKIGLVEPVAPVYVDWYLWVESVAGEGYLDELALQEPRIYPSAAPLNEAIVSGEVFASPYAFPTLITASKDTGAPVDFVVPDGEVWGAQHRGGVLRTAPHPNAGWLWYDFVLSEEAQTIVNGGGASVLPGVGLGDNASMHQGADLSEAEVTAFQERWRTLFA